MFIVIRILGMFLLVSQCNNSEKQVDQKPIIQQGVSAPITSDSLVLEDLISVTYEATGRGFFYQVAVNNQLIEKVNNRAHNDVKTKSCTKNEWSTIRTELKKIDLEKIKDLKTPANNKNVDRSLHAKLIITFSSQIYTSVSFDHGNPPEQIAPLVNTILSLAESIE